VIGAADRTTSATSALPVVGAAGAGAAAGMAAGAAAASAYGARNTLSRADALAAERDWVQEDDDYDEPVNKPERHGRSPWTWPLIALILLVLFALVGVMLTQAGILFPQTPAVSSSSATTTTSASPTSTSPSPTITSATPTQSTPATINVIPDAYKGRAFDVVRTELNNMGLKVSGDPVFDAAAASTVLDINPSGPVEPGETITVTYSKGPEPTKAPETTTAPETTKAPETTTAPTLQSGASEATIQQAIANAGLRWNRGADVNPTNKQEDPGTFVSTQPAPGSKVPAGSVVTYHLAKAVAVESTPSPTGT
jgi:hypothetical protein